MQPRINVMLSGTVVFNPMVLLKTGQLRGRITNMNVSASNPASYEQSFQLVVFSTDVSICLE